MRARPGTATVRSPTGRSLAVAGLAVLAVLVATAVPACVPRAAAVTGARATVPVLVNPAPGVPPLPAAKVTAAGWLVADLTTGDVLAARNPHGQFLPASVLKVLTALTLLPRLPPRQVVRVSNADESVDGTRAGLAVGMTFRVDELFTAMLVDSANDATEALSRAAGGDAGTVAAMNATALVLGAADTQAGTPTGLDARGQHTSVWDLALVSRAALQRLDFRRYVATRRASVRAPKGATIEIDTHNPLLGSYPGTFGVKNGFTTAAQASYVGVVRRGTRVLLVALLHAPPLYSGQARALLDWGFTADGRVRPVLRLPAPGAVTGSVRSAALPAGPGGAAPSPAGGGAAQPGAGHPRLAAAGPGRHGSRLALPVTVLAASLLAAGLTARRSAVSRRRHRRRTGRPVR